MRKSILVGTLGLALVGCTTDAYVDKEAPAITVGNLLGERVATQRIGERLICYYDVITSNDGRSFSSVLPENFKQCPDHVIKNMYTNQIDWGKM